MIDGHDCLIRIEKVDGVWTLGGDNRPARRGVFHFKAAGIQHRKEDLFCNDDII
jgi:hypothetical protein